MSHQRSARQKQREKERRAENRTLADAERRRRARNRRIRKVALWTGAVVVVVAVVGGAAVAIRNHIRAGEVGPLNMASDGLLLKGDSSSGTISPTTTAGIPAGGTPTPSATTGRSSGVIDLVLYLDYGDPRSAAFWTANGSLINNVLSGGYATLEIHPIAMSSGRTSYTATPVAGASPSPAPSASATPTPTPNPLATDQDYAARAANAFACVASHDPDHALKMHEALFAKQSSFGSTGLTDSALVAVAADAGATGATVKTCITSGSYLDWVAQATSRATTTTPFDSVGAVSRTPTVVVAGQPYTGSLTDSSAFVSFVSKVYSSLTASSATSTATPGAGETTPAATPAAPATSTP